MSLDQKLRDAKVEYELISVEDPSQFKKQVMESIHFETLADGPKFKTFTLGFVTKLRRRIHSFSMPMFMTVGSILTFLLLMTVLEPSRFTHQHTTGSGPSTDTFQTIFSVPYPGFVVVGVVLLSLILAMALEGKTGLKRITRALHSPVFWGSFIGSIVGLFGIPVPVSGTLYWIWEYPAGFYVPSVLIFGTLGCMVGLLIVEISKRGMMQRIRVWTYGLCSVALLIGLIGIFRLEAHNQELMWVQVDTGLVMTHQVSLGLNDNPSQKNLRAYGDELLVAGTNIKNADSISGEYRIKVPLYQVANALTSAGYVLRDPKSQQQLHTAERFVNRIDTLLDSTHLIDDSGSRRVKIAQIMKQTKTIIPTGYTGGMPST